MDHILSLSWASETEVKWSVRHPLLLPPTPNVGEVKTQAGLWGQTNKRWVENSYDLFFQSITEPEVWLRPVWGSSFPRGHPMLPTTFSKLRLSIRATEALCFLPLTWQWVSISSLFPTFPPQGCLCWVDEGVMVRQERRTWPSGGEEEAEDMGEETATWPVELLGAVGGFENVFTSWTHFHFQNSVFLAALIFSLKFYLTVLRLGSVVI